jgi:hypothetical protein
MRTAFIALGLSFVGVIVAWVLLMMALVSARAEDCPRFTEPTAEVERFYSDMMPGSFRVELSPAHVPLFEVYLNASEPPTDWRVARAWWVYDEQYSALVAIVGEGCAWSSGLRSHGYIQRWLRGAMTGAT